MELQALTEAPVLGPVRFPIQFFAVRGSFWHLGRVCGRHFSYPYSSSAPGDTARHPLSFVLSNFEALLILPVFPFVTQILLDPSYLLTTGL